MEKRRRFFLFSTILFCICLLVGLIYRVGFSQGQNQENKGPGAMHGDPLGKVKANPQTDQVSNLAMARALIQYGRRTRSPEALITAAKILSGIKKIPLSGTPSTEQGAGTSDNVKKPASPPSEEPSALLAEAKKMSGNDPHVIALANRAARFAKEYRSVGTRGVVGGPKYTPRPVLLCPSCRDKWTFSFYGNEPGRVAVAGDGNTWLRVSVYDLNGNYITSNSCQYATCVVDFIPYYTTDFEIYVENLGSSYNYYALATN